MARLPNAEQAVLDLRKIKDYFLNPTHPRGRHKARVFRRALALGPADAGWLAESLLEKIRFRDAVELLKDDFGSRWQVDVVLSRDGQTATIRSIWIIPVSESRPRLVTCWIR